MPKSTSDNFESIYDVADVTIKMEDPNNTSPMEIVGGGPFAGGDVPQFGAFKNTKTDMSGPSGMMSQQYAGNETGLDSSESMMHPTQSDSTSLPVAGTVNPMTFGDPNDTSLDFKDGSDPNTVTIGGGESNDISRYGFGESTAGE